MKLVVPLLAGLFLFLHTAIAATGFKTQGLLLYQPDEVLQSRISSVQNLADYCKKLEAASNEFFAATTQPETLDIIVVVKPGKHARFWFLSSTQADDKALEPLRKKLETVPAFEVFSGPVAFAITGAIAGGDGKPVTTETRRPPLPKEWTEAAKGEKGPLQIPDGFIPLVWPDEPGNSAAAPAPEGFVTQVLEPTGGRIFKPKDWFYVENHHGPVYMWTLSKEDSADKHPYTTGVRIQLFAGVKQNTGKSPKEFLLDFVAKKKKEAAKVVNSCEPKDQGLFTRMCLETEEGPFHILYSLFWGSRDLDIAVISISGTNKELWSTFTPTFDRMSAFELIDMKRFEPAKEVSPPMTRLESRLISPDVPADSFAAKPKVIYRAGTSYLRSEEQPDPTQGLQQLIVVHEPDIWFCNLLKRDGQHIVDHGPTYLVHAPILPKGPSLFSTLDFGNETQFFADHHASALPAQAIDGQACEVSELKDGAYRVVLFQRADTHQPFHLDVFKDDKIEFSIRYSSYQSGLPFDAALFTPPKDCTITEAKPDAGK